MTKRGKVLRDPTAGPGLLMVEGQQYLFALEPVWKSDVPPKPGLVVDVDLDGSGKIQAITVVPESQLASEQAEAVIAMAREKSGTFASSLGSRLGMPDVIAACVLVVAWWFLTAVSIQVPFLGKLEFTFWQVLGFLNGGSVLEWLDRSGSPGAGLYGVLAVIAFAGPFLHYFWKDSRAMLGGMLPLIFMVVIGIVSRNSIQHAIGGGLATDGSFAAMKEARPEAMQAVSLDLGSYVAIFASLYLASTSASRLLASKAHKGQKLEPAARKAA